MNQQFYLVINENPTLEAETQSYLWKPSQVDPESKHTHTHKKKRKQNHISDVTAEYRRSSD